MSEEQPKEEPLKESEQTEDEADPRVVIGILALVAAVAIAGGLFLRQNDERSNFIAEQEVESGRVASEQGVVRDGRYLGYLISFRIPEGAQAVTGESDGYSETASWENRGGRGDLSAIPLLPGETLSDIAATAGLDPKTSDIGGRPALVNVSRVRGLWIAQVQVLAGDYKVTVSNIDSDRSGALAGAKTVAASLAQSRG